MKLILLFLLLTSVTAFSYAQCSADAGSNQTACIGSTLTLGATPAATGIAPLTYTWSPTTGLSCSDCPNPQLTVVATQTYTLTIEDANGCTATDQVTIIASALPNAAFTIIGNNNCADLPIQFTNNSTGANLTYSWNFGDPASGGQNLSTQTNPTHTFNATGSGTQTFTVTLTATNDDNCSSTITQTVTVRAIPGPALSDPISEMKNCDGSDFSMTLFDVSATTDITNYTIQWGDGSPNFSSATFSGAGVSHTYTTAEVFPLQYTITGTNGCTQTASYDIANITNPAIGAANPGATTGCGPVTLCFPLNNYASNHSSTYYVVDYGDGSPTITLPHPPPAEVCHTYTTSSCGLAGNQFIFRIKAVNMCDSSEASISPIRVYTGPVSGFTVAAENNCVGSPVTFINNTQSGFNSACSSNTLYQWDFGDGQTLTTTTATNPTHVYTAPGVYTVTLSTTNSCTSNISTRQVCIEAPPTPNFTINPTSNCVPFTAQITDNSIMDNTCQVTRNWTVFFNGSPCTPNTGGFSFVGGTNASSPNPQIEFTQAGNYTVRLTLTNSCGSFIANQTVVAQTVPQVTLPTVASICANTSANPSATVIDCLEPVDSYSWTFTGGVPASASTLSPGSILYPNDGTFPIVFEATNACGTTTRNISITVRPIPPALNPQVNSPVCVGETANFTSDPLPGGTYSWTGPAGFTSNQQNFSITNITPARAGTYTLTPTLAGCVGPSASVDLVVTPLPVVTINPPTASICIGNTIDLTASGADSYTWTPTATLSSATDETVTASPTATTTYTVTGTTGNCSSTATATVTVNPLPIVDAGPDMNLCDQPIPVQLIGTPAGGTWSGTNVTPTGEFTPNGVGTNNLTYTYTNANGCTNSDETVITVIAPTPALAGSDSTLCQNSPVVVLTGSPVGGTWTGSFVTAGGNFTPNTPGNYELVYTFGTGTCLSRDTLIMTVNPLPVVDAGANTAVCIDGGIQQYNGTPTGGIWTGNGIIDPNTGEFDPTTATIGNNILTYSFTDGNGCSNTDQVQITVNPLPIVSAGPDTTACNQPTPFTLSKSPTGGTWSGPNITPTGVFTPNGTGIFTVTYTYTDANGCTNFDTRDITIIDPTQAQAGPDFAVCIDAPNVTLTPTPTGGTWSGTNVTTAGVFDPTTPGNFELVYTFGSGACLSRDTLVATVFALPVVDAGINGAYCIDAAIQTLTGTPVGGTWTGTGITNPIGEFDPAIAGTGTHTITYQYTDGNGCINSDNIQLIVHPLPVVNAGIDSILCNQAQPVQVVGTPAGGTWSGTGITSTGQFTPAGLGSYTLTYTYTNANGCTNSDERIFTVVVVEQSDAGPDLEACINGPAVQLTSIPSTGTWTGTNVTTSGLFNPITVGTFPLVISNGAGNCLSRDTMLFVVHDLPVVDAGPDFAFCPTDNAVNLIGTPANGLWSGNGITDSNAGEYSPGVPTVGTHPITYTYTDPITTCVNSDVMNVTIHPLPVADFSFNPITCVGTNETFTNNSTLADSYVWDFGDGSTSTLQAPQHAFAGVGFYDIELIAYTAFGCSDTLVQQIEVRDIPIALFSLTPDSACGPMNVNFTDLSIGQSLTYSWDYGNGQTSTDPIPVTQTYVASQTTDTSYTITLQLTNFCGTHTHQEDIIVMPSPTAVFGTLVDIGCTPLVLDFVNNSYGLPDTYEWDFGDGTFATFDSLTFQHTYHTGANDTTYLIRLVVANECGSDTVSHHITVIPPQVNAFFNTDNPSGCVPHTVNFTQFSQGSLFASWDFGDGNMATTYHATHTFTQPGTYTVSLFATGCGNDTATAIITVHPKPDIAFSSLDSVCQNQQFSFTNQSTGVASVNWDFGDGNTSTLTHPTHSYTAPGNYLVTLSGVSQTYGCTTEETKTIKVNPAPSSQFTLVGAAGCVDHTVQVTNTSTGIVNQVWSFGDGNFTSSPNATYTYTTPGTYALQLIVLDAIGCTDTATQVVVVHPLPIVDFDPIPVDPCVQPTVYNFTNQSTNAITYSWSFGNGQTSTFTNPSTTFNQVGTYDVKLVGISIHGCMDSVIKQVSSFQNPIVSFTIPDDTLCKHESLSIQAETQFTDSLHWYLGNGVVLTGNPLTYNYPFDGTFQVTLIAYGEGGCTQTVTAANPLVVLPSPIADFTYEVEQDGEASSGMVHFTNTSEGADQYWWDLGNGSTSSELNPSEFYTTWGEFDVLLVATNHSGCIDTARRTIELDFYYGLFIPNAMSPGHSDFEVANFVPKGVGMQTFELLIYDDWGNLIWSTNALDEDGRPTEYWDGTYRGKPVQQDAYVWKAEATFMNSDVWQGKEYPKGKIKRSGTVTVIR